MKDSSRKTSEGILPTDHPQESYLRSFWSLWHKELPIRISGTDRLTTLEVWSLHQSTQVVPVSFSRSCLEESLGLVKIPTRKDSTAMS